MKTLLLMRHGKSSWSEEALADHDRPLKKRGQDAADRIGLLLSESKLVPDHIQTSSAVRALETTQRVIQAAKWIGDAEVVTALYHADPKSLVAIVSRVQSRRSVARRRSQSGLGELADMSDRADRDVPDGSIGAG